MNLLNKFSIIVLLSTASYSVDVDKHLELSYVQTSGNTNTTTFSSKLEGTAGLSDTQSIRAKGSMLYNENENNTSANKYNLELDYNHMINKKLYANMGINYLKDELSDYDYRLNFILTTPAAPDLPFQDLLSPSWRALSVQAVLRLLSLYRL